MEEKKRRKLRRKRRQARRRFFFTFIISLLIFSFIFTKFIKKANPEENIGPSSGKNKDEVVFLVVGIDSYDIASAQGQRTDTMILSKVNFKTGDIDLVSIPRDTRVDINGEMTKINHAHAWGGMDLTMNTVENFLRIDLDKYVRIDYRAVEEIVDTMGGIDLYIPQDMNYDDPTPGKEFHVDLKEGQQLLDGKKSIQFLRWRKNNNGQGYAEGDVGRIKAQQYFMKELIKQGLRPKNFLKLPKFISIYNNYIDTNLDLSTVLKGAWTTRKIDFDRINTQTLPGTGQYIGKVSYFIADEEALNFLINQVFNKYRK